MIIHSGTLRRGLALVLAFLTGACAAPVPPREAPLSYPPAARTRMLAIALAEWRDWGGRVVEADRPGSPGAAPAETDPANFPRILAYWRAVDADEGAIAHNRPLYRAALVGQTEGAALWTEPYWSAAFISYVMRTAGVDRAEFPGSAAHSAYVDALIAQAREYPGQAPFIPHGPTGRAPRPGDLICADRTGTLTDWRQRAADQGRFRPMHCDIVVSMAPGVIGAIGGNVRDAVTLTRFPADANGYLLPRAPQGGTEAGVSWFVVFENRLGCLPPWGPPCPPDRSPDS